MGADAAETYRLTTLNEARSSHERARNRARGRQRVVGVEFDLQAALAPIEEHAGMVKRGGLDRDRYALFLAEWRDAADMVAGQPFGVRRAHHLRRLGPEGAGELFHADFAVRGHH